MEGEELGGRGLGEVPRSGDHGKNTSPEVPLAGIQTPTPTPLHWQAARFLEPQSPDP